MFTTFPEQTIHFGWSNAFSTSCDAPPSCPLYFYLEILSANRAMFLCNSSCMLSHEYPCCALHVSKFGLCRYFADTVFVVALAWNKHLLAGRNLV